MGSGKSGLYHGAEFDGVFVGSIDFMTPGDMFSQFIKRRRDIDANGFYDVIAHGAPKMILVEHNGTPVLINHRSLARLLENDSRTRGKAIRLLSCNTGKVPRGFAQGLADKLGVDVKAPTEYLWTDSLGHYYVAAGRIVNKRIVPDFSKPGKFETYHPQRRKKK